ncbi:cAMP-specific 3',5'-cyclic phosphodiesterase [Drosophila persimilis]|uniref:cAMP-specific 3',5'-cyclic phosphodiesterase n=1 Tax=Drosophila persimilis TaxID=7234 RepID=UPI000F08927C|nr:cAMP-specific 3',5'-cyclic phosphodiesterase [Drosophila persimilis]
MSGNSNDSNGNGGAGQKQAPPPQYIITTPSEVDAEELRSMEMDMEMGSPAGSEDSVFAGSSTTAAAEQRRLQQVKHSQKFSSQTSSSSTTKVATRSYSVTSSSTNNLSSIQQQQQTSGSSNQAVGNSASTTSSKSKFQSFLQQPEGGSHGFLTAHQKHVRQFVRSTSAHSEAAAGMTPVSGARPEKCIRSASTQIDDATAALGDGNGIGSSNLSDSTGTGGSMQLSMSKLGLQQSSSILISKSAETIEMKSSSAGMRTQLTLSGGFLAPPNRKITILSPIHAPPGLHDMLKRAGRSPLSPRISFPGSETDLFGSSGTTGTGGTAGTEENSTTLTGGVGGSSLNNNNNNNSSSGSGCGSATGATGNTSTSTWCGSINFLVYMVCSFCCCCYNFRNSPSRKFRLNSSCKSMNIF